VEFPRSRRFRGRIAHRPALTSHTASPLTLSAARTAEQARAGTLSATSIARACNARIAQREPQLRAWAWHEPQQLLRQAEAHDAKHTPGGSSSGSAAAVADGMVALALGSQTGGSTIRPSAYCGIVGFKPGYGVLPTAGMRPLAPSLDTVGLHARDVRDVALLF